MLGSVFGGILGALEMLLLSAVVVAAYALARWARERSPDAQRTMRLTGLVVLAASVLLGVLVGGDQRLRAFFYFLPLLGVPGALAQVPPATFTAWFNRLLGGSERDTPR